MPSRSHLLSTGALLLTLLYALQPAHAQPARTPRQLIDNLGVEVRQILETSKPDKTPEDAERAVAAQIMALSQGAPGHLSLTELNEYGRTPLMLAARGGYPLVVQALLADPGVKLRINVRDAEGATAWMEANFAPTLTLAACQPGVLTAERYLLLPPYLRRMAHLLKAQGTAIGAIVRQLEEAGAEAQPEDAKRVWLARCPNATPELRAALADGALMPTLTREAVSRQSAFNKAALENIASVPARPPEGMKFVTGPSGPDEGPISPLLTVHQMNCVRMAHPQVPRTDWTGSILLKAIAQIRDGIVETADIQLIGEPQRPNVVEVFRKAILMALSGYQCPGDHVFEQVFQFKID
ncbi:ankyrin repeat domain-containing protein [Roseateles sp.]|uniref:ankyrin repeat domain-containing protein n=1 Tax=Roseateles sp. TaxID=1971397 RepID=UPI003264E37C